MEKINSRVKSLLTLASEVFMLKNVGGSKHLIRESAFVIFIFFIVGSYFYIAHSASFTFTQTNWVGGLTANDANHSNQTGWTEYSATSTGVVANSTSVSLLPISYAFTDDLATSTTPSASTSGGGFGNGTHSSTMATSSGGSIRIATSSVSTFANVGSYPNALKFDSAGNLYILKVAATGSVAKVTPAGATSTFATVGSYPRAFAFDTDGNLFVSNNDSISKITTGGSVSVFANVGSSWSLVFDTTGNLYSANSGSNTVNKITPAGSVTTFATLTGSNPYSMAFDASWNLYTANNISNNITKITPAGATSTFASVAGGPTSLAFDTDGNLFVSRSDVGAISKITTGGSPSTFISGLANPYALAFDAFGNLYVTNYDAATVSKINSSGTIVETFAVGTNPKSLAFDASGNLYVGSYNTAGTITKIVQPSSGVFTSAIVNLGAKVSFTTLGWADTLNSQTITMKARSSANSNMSGATDWGSCSNITKNANLSTGGCVTDGHQYIQYQATLSTNNTTVSPTLDSVTIGYTQYSASGTLTSSVYDSGSNENLVSKLTWNATIPGVGKEVKFQVRSATSSSALSYAVWCGYEDVDSTCIGSNYFTATSSGLNFPSNHPLRNGANDRFFQYKVYLISDGDNTPSLDDVTVTYVVNVAPDFDTSYHTSGAYAQQITDSQSPDFGKVSLTYKVRDSDGDSGTTNPGQIYPSFEYNIGGGWFIISTSTISSGATDLKNVGQVTYSTFDLIWDAKTQLGVQYVANAQIRVKANDNELANNVGVATTTTFVLDTTSPNVSAHYDGRVGKLVLTATDSSQFLDYVLSNNSNMSSSTTGLGTTTSLVLNVDWTPPSSTSTVNVYSVLRDIYGNTSTTTLVIPAVPMSLGVRDVSVPSYSSYKEFLLWPVYPFSDEGASFEKYEVYRSTNNVDYSLISSITSSSTNFYIDSSVSSSTNYYYKVGYQDTDGDTSGFSQIVSDIPDGQGGTDNTAPTISNVQITNISNISATITWTTDEFSNSEINVGNNTSSYNRTASSQAYVLTHSVNITGLTPNQDYVARIKSTDPSNNLRTNDNNGQGFPFTTLGGPLITSVTASPTDNSGTAETITWTTDNVSDSTVIYGTDSRLNTYAQATGNSGTTTHIVNLTNLISDTPYYYQVKSMDALSNLTTDNNSGDNYSFSTVSDTKSPVISNVLATSTANMAMIIWDTDKLADSEVRYGTATGTYTMITKINSLSAYHLITLSEQTMSLSGNPNLLSASTTYYYVVKSTDSHSNSTTTEERTFTTTGDTTLSLQQQVTSLQNQMVGMAQTSNNINSGNSQTVVDTTPPVLSDIVVEKITPFSATISFKTNEPTRGLVEYGKDKNYGQSSGDSTFSNTHTITLSGLVMGSDYHYNVSVIDRSGNTATHTDQTFKTSFLSENLGALAQIVNGVDTVTNTIENLIESALPSINPPFISNPKVIDITEDSATITWKTNIKSYGSIYYSVDDFYSKEQKYKNEETKSDEKVTEHVITLNNLKSGSEYHFKVRSYVFVGAMAQTGDLTFVTKAGAVQAEITDKKNDSFRVIWSTPIPTTSVVEYKKVGSSKAEKKTDVTYSTYHDVRVENVIPGTTYTVRAYGETKDGTLIESKNDVTVTTGQDMSPPDITGFKVESTLVPGRNDKVQTIVYWKTDEPSTSVVYYDEGAGSAQQEFTNKQEDISTLTQNHVVILTNLKPGTVYRIQVGSSDDSNNTTKFPVRTIITPRQSESIVDVIFKNFDSTFNFVNSVGH